MLHEVLDLWKRHGLEAGIVSGGSTPTAYQSHHVTAGTEIRPGTYIYNDRDIADGGWCAWEDCAAAILTTVVSTAVPDQVVVDAGAKTLTYDRYFLRPADKDFGRVVGLPEAKIVALSEEHGQINVARCEPATRPALGQRISIIMNHVCPCVNLMDHVWLKHPDGSLEPLKIDARGLLS
jgi:D-serine deaminase-like pyridoxal phosphate-dependent protein